MPIDPSIFMQGAQLRANQAAQTQATIGNFFDKLAAQKEKQRQLELARATDYEGAYMRTLQAQANGQQVDPQTMSMAKAYETSKAAEVASDQFGNLYPKYQPQLKGVSGVMGAMGTQPSSIQYQSPYSTPQGINPNAPMPPMPKGNGAVNDLGFEMLPVGDNYSDVSQVSPAQRDMARGVSLPPNTPQDLANSPYAKKQMFEANLELQKQAEKEKMALETKKQEPMNATQSKVATFADRMIEANNIINDKYITESQLSLKERTLGDIPKAGNYLVSKNYQKAKQAERNFINAVLRQESGAVISPEEFDNARQQYFPQAGDSPDVVAQKAQNRKTAIDGFIREAGATYNPKPQVNTDLKSMSNEDLLKALNGQ